MTTLRIPRAALLRRPLLTTALALCAAVAPAHAAGWTRDLAPDIRALAQAGGRLFAFSYTTGQKPKLVIQCVNIDNGQVMWSNALDHMRTDVVHVDAVGDGDSVYVTVADATNPLSGYLLSTAAVPSVFELKKPRPGFMPGVAVIDHHLFATTGEMDKAVQWRGLNAGHTKWASTVGLGAPSGCIGKPVGLRGRVLLPEAGALVVATLAGKAVARIPVGKCAWGQAAPLGTLVAVMTSGEGTPMVVAGVNLAARKVVWRVPAPPNPDKVKYSPTLTTSGGRAFATYATTAQIIDATGKVAAKVPMRGVRQVIPASAGRVVVALTSKHVLLVDLKTGATRDLGVGEDEINAMTIMRGHLFVAAGLTLRDWGSL